MKTIYIYALICPIVNQVRYIGKSIRPLERLKDHMNDKSKCHRANWLQSLKAGGLKPEIIILEEIRGNWPWQESEIYWIDKGKKLGWPLTNNTSGGDGVQDLPEEVRNKISSAWIGRRHRESTIQKIKDAKTGVPIHSNAHKEKMSKIMKGREITWGDAISEKLKKLTDDDVQDIKERLSRGEMDKDLAAEYGVHRTTLSKIKTGKYGVKYDGCEKIRYRKSKSK